jgi:hypothetical protein
MGEGGEYTSSASRDVIAIENQRCSKG